MDRNDLHLVCVIAALTGFLLGTTAWSYDTGTLWSDEAAGWFQAVASVLAIVFAAVLPFRLEKQRQARENLKIQLRELSFGHSLLTEVSFLILGIWGSAKVLQQLRGLQLTPALTEDIARGVEADAWIRTPHYDALVGRQDEVDFELLHLLQYFYLKREIQLQYLRTVLTSFRDNPPKEFEHELIVEIQASAVALSRFALDLVELDEVFGRRILSTCREYLADLYPQFVPANIDELRDALQRYDGDLEQQR